MYYVPRPRVTQTLLSQRKVSCLSKAACYGFHCEMLSLDFMLDSIMCRLLVLGVTTYDIHRSIEANQTPPTQEQVAALTAQIEQSRQSGESPKNAA